MDKEPLPVWDLMRTAHVLGLRFGELFADHHLTPTQFGILHTLAASGGMTQAELAREVLVRPQSIGVLISTLIDRGLVERRGPGGRGRRTALALTDPGRDALELAWPMVRDFNSPAALGLTPAQSAMLEEILETVRDNLGPQPRGA